ncbi:unnamed protein product [Rotaria sp. Silwood2]|nr:unnamed protein product [Rotaria sp. Silwood2]
MDLADITEFRTTWNNEIFLKNKSAFLTAKRLIRKSIIIVQARLCRQLKYAENNLTIELQAIEHEKQILNNYSQSNSLAEHLQQKHFHDDLWLNIEQTRLITHKLYSNNIYDEIFIPFINNDCHKERSINDILTYLDNRIECEQEQVIDMQDMKAKLSI